ncbi:hypothetical protein [Gluconobacter wancherniae]|uniref:hypothetical protein n=1 Tax=Gluconobacter wancherniae TaxID=1307955 RepID=UPI001B8B574D|nr:hypothetical protein [Gluconobacter wancherniae]MBS1093662.1 hypothetical protein [Gluconobacter wancherniae]
MFSRGLALSFLAVVAFTPLKTAFAADENISVTAERSQKVADYRDVAHMFRRFDRFPAAARQGLSLHLIGWVDPGHELPSESHLMIRAKSGEIPLFAGTDHDMHFPVNDVLWAENPPIIQRLPADRIVKATMSIEVSLPQASSFSKFEAQHWLKQIDACIEDIVGVIFSFLMPDAHRLRVEVAPGATLEAVSGGNVCLLLDNRDVESRIFLLRVQDYPEGTVFRSSKPFVRVSVKIPGDPSFAFTPDK